MSWNPDPGLRNYNGPYPIRDLLAARQELIAQLRNTDNVLLERTKPKIGIASRFGPPVGMNPIVRPSPSDSRTSTQSTSRAGASSFPGQQTEKPATITKIEAPQSTSQAQAHKNGVHTLNGNESNSNNNDNIVVKHEAMVKKYKCDYCSFMCVESCIADAEKHLILTGHMTISLYRVKSKDAQVLESVVERMSIKNPSTHRASLTVVCPTCRAVFKDIFTCGVHTRMTHGSARDCYAVCPIVKEQPLTLWANPIKCTECEQEFKSFPDLHNHWKSDENHNPLHDKVAVTFNIGICTLCPKENSFPDAIALSSHLITKHYVGAGNKFTVKRQSILQPKQVDYLPHNEDPEQDGERKDHRLLKEMKRKSVGLGVPREETTGLKNEVPVRTVKLAKRETI